MTLRTLSTYLVAATAAVGLTAVGTTSATAAEATGATSASTAKGTFYYSDLLAGTGSISNPTLGTCYTLPTLALSATNSTNATAHLYTGTNCSLLANDLPPGNTINTWLFISVKFG
ncbi:hypothetical protein [Streptomyces sp. NPDC005876]|uniref:hypothetical protein n=1 Tax=unclassified Streptomyces TaxID=2593676 RepID=UPI0033F8FDB1